MSDDHDVDGQIAAPAETDLDAKPGLLARPMVREFDPVPLPSAPGTSSPPEPAPETEATPEHGVLEQPSVAKVEATPSVDDIVEAPPAPEAAAHHLVSNGEPLTEEQRRSVRIGPRIIGDHPEPDDEG